MFDHNGAEIEYYRGVAQVVEHRIWDAGAASSNLVTPTKIYANLRSIGCRFAYYSKQAIILRITLLHNIKTSIDMDR